MRKGKWKRITPACGRQGHSDVFLKRLEAGGDGIDDHTFPMLWTSN